MKQQAQPDAMFSTSVPYVDDRYGEFSRKAQDSDSDHKKQQGRHVEGEMIDGGPCLPAKAHRSESMQKRERWTMKVTLIVKNSGEAWPVKMDRWRWTGDEMKKVESRSLILQSICWIGSPCWGNGLFEANIVSITFLTTQGSFLRSPTL